MNASNYEIFPSSQRLSSILKKISLHLDMKLAIISDIHSNLEALQAVLAHIDSMNVSAVYCLGDIVGYGANPDECVEVMRSRNIQSVAGNHDKAVIGEISVEYFSEAARRGVEWTRSNISSRNIEFLSGLSYQLQVDNALLVHSSPDSPESFRYLFDQDDAEESFGVLKETICFVGHTHRPTIFCEDGITQILDRGKRYIVNVGSVGQPRDGNWRSCFALYDTEQFSVNYIRVDYDVESTIQKIIAAGLPKKLADRLLIGI
jgi:putative phosphoesterase